MKRSSLFYATLFCLVTCGPVPAVAVESLDHHHATSDRQQLNHGSKWETDAPLRQGMAAIRGELAGKLQAIHKGSLSNGDYAILGRTIEAQIVSIVSQCRLEPKADATLHVVIGELTQAADVMQGKTKGKPADAAHRIVTALDSYGRYFNHPGWKTIDVDSFGGPRQ